MDYHGEDSPSTHSVVAGQFDGAMSSSLGARSIQQAGRAEDRGKGFHDLVLNGLLPNLREMIAKLVIPRP